MICSTPNTHIHNLDVALNGSNASPASPTIADRPQPLINHPQPLINHTILILIAAFQKAIQENDNFKLTSVDHQYAQAMKYNLDFFLYDRSNLQAVQNRHADPQLTRRRLHPTTCSITLCQLQTLKIVTDNWSGQSYDFYP